MLDPPSHGKQTSDDQLQPPNIIDVQLHISFSELKFFDQKPLDIGMHFHAPKTIRNILFPTYCQVMLGHREKQCIERIVSAVVMRIGFYQGVTYSFAHNVLRIRNQMPT